MTCADKRNNPSNKKSARIRHPLLLLNSTENFRCLRDQVEPELRYIAAFAAMAPADMPAHCGNCQWIREPA
jgi:hypothetical protein